MKSLSLDSPESTELHSQIRRRYPPAGPSHYQIGVSSMIGNAGGGPIEHTPPSNNSRLHCKLVFIFFMKSFDIMMYDVGTYI